MMAGKSLRRMGWRARRLLRRSNRDCRWGEEYVLYTSEKNGRGLPEAERTDPGTAQFPDNLHPFRNLLPLLFIMSFLLLCGPVLAMPEYMWQWDSSGSTPSYVAVTGSGNILVTDVVNENVVEYDPTGTTIVNSWGTWGTANGDFKTPQGIAIDSSGNIYVVDSLNNRVQEFTSTGTFTQEWGGTAPGSSPGQFNNPTGIAIDSSNNVYVTDSLNNRVEVYNSATGWNDFIPSSSGVLNNPTGVAVDGSGDVYVADTNNGVVRFFDPYGDDMRDLAGFTNPTGVAVDVNGNLYFMDITHLVNVYDSNGNYIMNFGSYGSGDGSTYNEAYFNNPVGIAVDGAQNLYIADKGNGRVQSLSMTDLVSVDFTASPTSGTEPLDVTFTDTSTGTVNPTSWSWNFGDGGTSTAENPSYTYNTAGTYTVTLTLTDAFGTASSPSQTITVNPILPFPIVSFTTDTTSGPAPLAVQFNDTSNAYGAAMWNWSFGNGPTSWFNTTNSAARNAELSVFQSWYLFSLAHCHQRHRQQDGYPEQLHHRQCWWIRITDRRVHRYTCFRHGTPQCSVHGYLRCGLRYQVELVLWRYQLV